MSAQKKQWVIELKGGAWRATVAATERPSPRLGVPLILASHHHGDVESVAMVAHRSFGGPKLDGSEDLKLVSIWRAFSADSFTVKEVR